MKRIRACRLREAGAAAAAFSFAGNCEVYPDGAVCSSPRMSTLRDHRRHQAARARRLRIDQLVEAEPCHCRPHGVDMAVKLRPGAFEIATARPKLFTLSSRRIASICAFDNSDKLVSVSDVTCFPLRALLRSRNVGRALRFGMAAMCMPSQPTICADHA